MKTVSRKTIFINKSGRIDEARHLIRMATEPILFAIRKPEREYEQELLHIALSHLMTELKFIQIPYRFITGSNVSFISLLSSLLDEKFSLIVVNDYQMKGMYEEFDLIERPVVLFEIKSKNDTNIRSTKISPKFSVQ